MNELNTVTPVVAVATEMCHRGQPQAPAESRQTRSENLRFAVWCGAMQPALEIPATSALTAPNSYV